MGVGASGGMTSSKIILTNQNTLHKLGIIGKRVVKIDGKWMKKVKKKGGENKNEVFETRNWRQ